tara:strand:- start:856 stop:1785 length:930 start_codon:yes stop_codon:yes gene_type:complete
MKLYKPNFWDESNISIISILLYPISLILRLLFLVKSSVVKKIEFSIPVICVGNIYIGGTGKTPLTIKIFELVKKMQKNPIVIKKYYKNQFDETNLLSKVVDLSVDKSRIKAINKSLEKGFDVAVLDDGLQDRSIKKKLSIVCFNSNQLIGNGFTIPSGPLREPIKSIHNFDIVVINGNKNKNFENLIKNNSKTIKFFYTNYIPTNIDNFKNKKVLAFAGIGNPENFFQILSKNNVFVEKKLAFPDHYNYSKDDINKINYMAKEKNLEIITTEKDYLRLRENDRSSINYLSLKLKISNEKEFTQEIKKIL